MGQIVEEPWLYPLTVEYNRRKICRCEKKHYLLDFQNRLVYCKTCGAIIDPFDALMNMAKNAERIEKSIGFWKHLAKEEEKSYNRFRGVNDITKKHRMGLVPVCPHCKEPVEPEDIKRFVKSEHIKEQPKK